MTSPLLPVFPAGLVADPASCDGAVSTSSPVRRPRPARRRFDRDTPDLGSDPPLDGSDGVSAEMPRHAVSLRWFGASVLTGIAGAVLLGSAIVVSTDGDMIFAEPAESAAPATRPADEGGIARKADKLIRQDTVASAKQVFKAPMTLRVGEREIIKVRSFVRIATALSMTSGTYATQIPPFDPTRFFTDSPADRIADGPPETSDAEVSVAKRDLSILAPDFTNLALTDEDVAEQLREEARLRAESGRRSAVPLPSALMLMRPLGVAASPGLAAGGADPAFRSIEVRVVPENVSTIEKAAPRPELALAETTASLRRGDSVEAVLVANGATVDAVRAILSALGRDKLSALGESGQVRLLTGPAVDPGGRRRLMRATIISERGIEAVAALNDRGSFVSVALPSAAAPEPPPARPSSREEDDEEDEGTGVTLYDSLWETALKQDLPRATVEELVRVFGYDVDFQKRVGPGDSFDLFYTADEDTGSDKLEILSAALTVGGEAHRVFRFQGDDGTVEYFDGAGRSLKKFLLRKPVPEGRISSPFGSRFHPILGYSKMHTGVDFAAHAGTPIFAAGNGTVLKAEWSSGYGRRTELQHPNGYVTAYNHQSAFGRGITAGAKVRQGQIIGYVGSSGLSTGAHLHYEVLVNGHFVDPMKIRLPRGRELDGRLLADFGRQRDQIESLIGKAGGPSRLAQRDGRG